MKSGELINNLRAMGMHDMADWVTKDTISRGTFNPDDFRQEQAWIEDGCPGDLGPGDY